MAPATIFVRRQAEFQVSLRKRGRKRLYRRQSFRPLCGNGVETGVEKALPAAEFQVSLRKRGRKRHYRRQSFRPLCGNGVETSQHQISRNECPSFDTGSNSCQKNLWYLTFDRPQRDIQYHSVHQAYRFYLKLTH